MLVTAFYIINIQPKSQDIIADRLPKGVLVANNAEQNPNHIPSNQEVLVALDNYVKTHKLFIVATVVTPEGNAGFHPEYMTFGKGILGNDMILFYSPKLTVQTMNYWVWVQLIIF